ncbi:hypothetical protein YC2023_071967 [Brassica napus]
MNRGFLGPSRKEPAGLCTIRKSKREVSIDTLPAASIDSIHHQSIDTIHPTSIDNRQATVIDRANKSSKNTVHRGTIHRDTVHPGTVHHNTIHPSTVHRDTIHRDIIYLPSIDTIQIPLIDTIHVPSINKIRPASIDTIHTPSIDTVHPVSVDTIHLPLIDTVHILSLNTVHPNTAHRDTVHPNTVHRNTIHRGTVPPMTKTTYGETEKVEALILKIEKKGIWRDEEGRPCSRKGQLINAEGNETPDVIAVAETNTFDLTSQWYNWGSEDLLRGLPHKNPRNHIEELDGLVSRCKQKQISEDLILCKIFPHTISGDAFSGFSKLQPRSLLMRVTLFRVL